MVPQTTCNPDNCPCKEKFDEVRKHLDFVTNPESGALSQMHEKMNEKISWVAMEVGAVVLIFILGGSFAYTALEASSIRSNIKNSNDAQDAQSAELRAEFSSLRNDLRDVLTEAKEATASINAHREYTEGRKPEILKRPSKDLTFKEKQK